MTTSNVSGTIDELIGFDGSRDVQLDGDRAGAIFRVVLDWDRIDQFEAFVEDELHEVDPDTISVSNGEPIYEDAAIVEVR